MKSLKIAEITETLIMGVVFEDYTTDYPPGCGRNVALYTSDNGIYEAGEGKKAGGTLYIIVERAR